jgi:shikimate kinase
LQPPNGRLLGLGGPLPEPCNNRAAAIVCAGMTIPAPSRSVFLIGPMGSGKTAVGKQLARLLELTFYDSDVEIERRTGVDIPYIFEKEGESGFREREREVIDSLTQLENVVIATGGGAVLLPQNREHLAERGRVVYLKTGIRQQLERTRHGRQRPLLYTSDRRRSCVS